jgi:hypothetical protein
LGEIFRGIYDPNAFELWLRDVLDEKWCGVCGESAPLERDLSGGFDDEALAKLGANAAAATTELECIKAKRSRVRSQLKALASDIAPLVTANDIASPDIGERNQACSRKIPEGKLPAKLSTESTMAMEDSNANVSVSMAPVDNSRSGVLYEGWVKRKAAHMPYSYQKHYAVLKPGGMLFFEKPGGVLKEHLDLNAGIVISPSDGFNRFMLAAAVRKEVFLEVPTSEQQDCWIEKLMAESGRILCKRNMEGK